MKLNDVLTESLIPEASGDHLYQIIDHKTKEPVGKPSKSLKRAHRRADKMDLEWGANRYGVRTLWDANTELKEFDRSDLELIKQVDREKAAKADQTRDRDEFRAKMSSREGQSLQSGDRVYHPKSRKMYVVKRVTRDGVLFKGANNPVKVDTKNTGKKTKLGHRVFTVG